MPKIAPRNNDTSPSPPPPQEDPIDLCDDDDDDDDVEEVTPKVSPDPPMRTPRPQNNDAFSSDWRKLITKARDRKKNPKLPECYYFNSRTGETSWFPPRPFLPGEEDETTAVEKVVDSKKSGMGRYFRSVRQPRVTPEEEVNMESEPEDEGEDAVEEDAEAEDEEMEELSEVEKIQRQVFTAQKPEFLRMKGEDGLIEKTKALGIYEDKILRAQLEQKLQQYWINELQKKGSKNPVDEYFLSPVFKQDEQDIMSERKENCNDKKRREFAKTAGTKDGGHKKSKKAPLSPEVSFALIISCTIIKRVLT